MRCTSSVSFLFLLFFIFMKRICCFSSLVNSVGSFLNVNPAVDVVPLLLLDWPLLLRFTSLCASSRAALIANILWVSSSCCSCALSNARLCAFPPSSLCILPPGKALSLSASCCSLDLGVFSCKKIPQKLRPIGIGRGFWEARIRWASNWWS